MILRIMETSDVVDSMFLTIYRNCSEKQAILCETFMDQWYIQRSVVLMDELSTPNI